ncbi:protein YIPF6 isoform X2 [Schistocerca gregaria]|uniref:protein YIPF6 isoform X2 n=1 Tax=Schistocerca gregaria TaxID=7010 RepID=UPI00211F36A4|nr:protein YIPF6 isoform X2 [Schistocerca gregaria]
MASGGEAKLDMYDDFSGSVEGEMIVPNQQQNQQQGKPDFNTLDEPIRDTVLRDLKAVGIKFFHVLYPKEKKSLLKEWDLWGPLLLCTFMAMILQGSSEVANDSKDGGPEFAEVFVIVWIGSMIVTVNSKLLGGNMNVGFHKWKQSCIERLSISRYCMHGFTTTLSSLLYLEKAVSSDHFSRVFASLVIAYFLQQLLLSCVE